MNFCRSLNPAILNKQVHQNGDHIPNSSKGTIDARYINPLDREPYILLNWHTNQESLLHTNSIIQERAIKAWKDESKIQNMKKKFEDNSWLTNDQLIRTHETV